MSEKELTTIKIYNNSRWLLKCLAANNRLSMAECFDKLVKDLPLDVMIWHNPPSSHGASTDEEVQKWNNLVAEYK